jgi:hypothetical protein
MKPEVSDGAVNMPTACAARVREIAGAIIQAQDACAVALRHMELVTGLRVVAVTIGRAGTERAIDQVSVCVGV